MLESIKDYFVESPKMDLFILGTILLFTIASLALFFALLISRLYHIRQDAHFIKNTETINNMFLEVLFNDQTYADLIRDKKLLRLFTIPQFRNQMMESVINLHHNYEGEYADRLKTFYVESQLLADSFHKLRNRDWGIKCKGIKEVSEMNIIRAFNTLVEISKSNNKILKINALNGCIKLNGPKGIIHLANHKYTIDVWTQLNIIDAIKKSTLIDTQEIEALLKSKNNSVISLGLKIIQTFKLFDKQIFVEELIKQEHAPCVLEEADKTLEILKHYGQEVKQ